MLAVGLAPVCAGGGGVPDLDAEVAQVCDRLIESGRAYGQANVAAEATTDLGAPELVLTKMAFKCYAYYVALPAMHWWSTGRVPDLSLRNVSVTWHENLRLSVDIYSSPTAVLPHDAVAGQANNTVVSDKEGLLTFIRQTLLDSHLVPVARELAKRYRIGAAPFYASIAGSVYALYAESLKHPGQAKQFRQYCEQMLAAFGRSYEKLITYTQIFDREGFEHWMPVRSGCCLAYQWESTVGSGRYCGNCRLIPAEQLHSKLADRGLSLEPPRVQACCQQQDHSDFAPRMLLPVVSV